MPSTYSTNLKIELQANGENSTTWGTITNTNLGTALEQAIVGYGNPSYASDANLTLSYTDTNAAQAARALVLNVTSAVSLSTTRELVVPTIQKQYIVQNNTTGSQSITVKTSGGTGVTVPNGRKAHLYVNGTDVIYMDDYVDINGGSIDGTTIGGSSAAAGTFTTLGATTGNITTVNATTVDTTNIEVTNLKAKDGTAAGSIADSTGVVTLGSSVLTTTDINGGTIDGTTIGGSSAAAGTFTTLTTSSTVTLNGGTANGVLYLNGSKVATSGSALTFSGTKLSLSAAGGADFVGVFTNTTAATPYILRVQEPATPTSGYPLLDVVNNAGSTAYLRVDSGTGNVGIGASSPAGKLDIRSASGSGNTVLMRGGTYTDILYSTGIRFLQPASTSNANRQFRFTSGDSSLTLQGIDGAGTDTADTNLILQPSGGNVGIGTASPSFKLQVVGNQRIQKDTAGYEAAMLSFSTLTETGAIYRMGMATGGAFAIGRSDTSTTNLTLDSSGSLGLGVTPSAVSASDKVVQVGSFLFNNNTNGYGILRYNNFFDGTSDKYINTGAASAFQMFGNAFRWYQAASGTAGNTISFTQAMTLASGGELWLGTSSGATSSNYTIFEIKGKAGLFSGQIKFNSGDGTNTGLLFLDVNGLCSGTDGAYPVRFYTNGTERGRFTSDGNFLVATTSGSYRIQATVDSGADRDMFVCGVTGVTNGLQVNYIHSNQSLSVRFNSILTTASAANAFLDGADSNRIYRSTSSIRYKKDIEDIDHDFADAALNLRPVWYRSKADSDNKDWSWYGLIAEEVAEVEPRLVHWAYPEDAFDVETVDGAIKKTVKEGAERIPDGVQYERLSVLLLDIVKRQNARIESLEAKVAALEAK